MLFFGGNKKKESKKRLKKLKKKQRLEMMRRQHIIIEARKFHEKSRKQADKYKSKGGFATVKTMEQEDFGFAVSEGIAKAIVMSGKAREKLMRREKSLNKSRNTHIARLKNARSKIVQRTRT